MKQMLVALTIGLTLLAAARCGTGPTGQDESSVNENPAMGLRKMILTSNMGAGAVIMDAHTGDHVTSLMSSTDGDASIYLSNGGAVIGGSSHAAVSNAAIAFTREVMKHAATLQPASEFPYPATGNVRFYLRTGGKTSFVEVPESELAAGTHALSPAYRAGQVVLTEYKKISAAAN